MPNKDLDREHRINESKALYYSTLLSIILAAGVLLLKYLFGPFLDPAFEFSIYYLPAVLLTAMCVWGRLKKR
jgi:hypothetical protein